MTSETLFVGIGSDHGGDRAGWLVADELAQSATSEAIIRRAKSPIDVLDWFDGVRWLGLCDACCGAGPIGTWYRWTWPTLDVPFIRPSGTHAYGLIDTLKLASRLGSLPETVQLWGVEIASDRPENPVTADVRSAIREVANDVARHLHSAASTHIESR